MFLLTSCDTRSNNNGLESVYIVRCCGSFFPPPPPPDRVERGQLQKPKSIFCGVSPPPVTTPVGLFFFRRCDVPSPQAILLLPRRLRRLRHTACNNPVLSPPLRPTPLGKKGENRACLRVTLKKRGPKKVDQTDPPACVILFAGWDEHCWMARLRVEEATELASAPLMLKKCFCLFSSPVHNLSFVKVPMEKTFVFFASFANCCFLLPLLPPSCPGVAFPPPLVPIFFRLCAVKGA